MKAFRLLLFAIVVSVAWLRGLCAETVTSPPSADTTLFETFPTNNLGATDLTSGSTAGPLRSRALLKFDLVPLMPSNASISSVTLTLTATRQPAGGSSSVYRLFRLLQPWKEGDKTGIHGAPASLGETNWEDRFAFQTGGAWSAPGASAPTDFSTLPSASLLIGGEGRMIFLSTSNLVDDARFWLSNPAKNYGWIIISDSENVPQTVTHFGSREDPTNAPLMTINFALPATAERPRIDQFHLATNTFILGIRPVANRSMTVQFVESLSTTNWQTLTTIPAQSSNAEILVADPIHGPRRFYRLIQFGAQSDLIFIPPGTFLMGSPTNEVDRFGVEGPRTGVTLNRGFWIGRNAVTQAEYQSVMGTNPSHFSGDLNLPVEQVNWFEATNYCGQLTQKERAAGQIGTNDFYRLPTEAEWEYACRAGTTTRFSYGDDPGYTNLSDYAWYSGNSSGITHPVGQKLPNPWGLYDMHGNVLNWCQDWLGTYPGGNIMDPQGPPSGSTRVIRGGGWLRIAAHCRSAFRHSFDPETRNIVIGFRVVLMAAPR